MLGSRVHENMKKPSVSDTRWKR